MEHLIWLKNGWRVSLGLAAVPAILMVIGSFFCPIHQTQCLREGKYEEAKQMLKKVRGTENVDHEFQDIRDACEAAKKVEHPWKNIRQSKYRPALVFCSAIPFFQQITGINVIMFYAPVLFKTLGFGDDAALMSAVITGVVNVLKDLCLPYTRLIDLEEGFFSLKVAFKCSYVRFLLVHLSV
uniref:Major facilitator superfamily (MFS) profile domain-containing protein n=1 Tax=Brassica oleracea TaxID=3712 RepID=A0A3P6FGF5_BRAOL|nr:unnamed protein product [Brassica oleracea]